MWKFYSYLLLPLPTGSFSLMHTVIWKYLTYMRLPTGKLREGDGTPLQYSCLENPMDGGAW